MAVEITVVDDHEIHVNDKPILRDMNGEWITTIELTTNEMQAFQEHIKVKAATDNEKP